MDDIGNVRFHLLHLMALGIASIKYFLDVQKQAHRCWIQTRQKSCAMFDNDIVFSMKAHDISNMTEIDIPIV